MQATALMLRVISGVAASSREHTEAPHARPHAESALNPGAGESQQSTAKANNAQVLYVRCVLATDRLDTCLVI